MICSQRRQHFGSPCFDTPYSTVMISCEKQSKLSSSSPFERNFQCGAQLTKSHFICRRSIPGSLRDPMAPMGDSINRLDPDLIVSRGCLTQLPSSSESIDLFPSIGFAHGASSCSDHHLGTLCQHARSGLPTFPKDTVRSAQYRVYRTPVDEPKHQLVDIGNRSDST